MASLADIDPAIRDRTLAVVSRTRASIPNLNLVFEETAARDDFDRDAVALWANAGTQRIRCIVSRTVLEDHYGTDGLDKAGRIKALQDNRPEIEAMLRQKYLHDPVEDSGLVILKTLDVERLKAELESQKPKKITKRKNAKAQNDR